MGNGRLNDAEECHGCVTEDNCNGQDRRSPHNQTAEDIVENEGLQSDDSSDDTYVQVLNSGSKQDVCPRPARC